MKTVCFAGVPIILHWPPHCQNVINWSFPPTVTAGYNHSQILLLQPTVPLLAGVFLLHHVGQSL